MIIHKYIIAKVILLLIACTNQTITQYSLVFVEFQSGTLQSFHQEINYPKTKLEATRLKSLKPWNKL